ncbi:MAG TPA: cupredoxin domain-containing protein [Thermoplasmata archaeon]|nr:cupredoxin domain-containing protein [Thermoplasmata archaeon]
MHVSRPLTFVIAISLFALSLLVAAPRVQGKNVTFVIEAKNITFTPDFLPVDPGDNVTIIVFNNESGTIPHTFDLDEFNIHLGTIARGENRSATFIADRAGTFYFYCSIFGHATPQGGGRWTGMAGRLQVGPPPPDATPVIVGGLAVLFVSLAAIAFVARRGAKKPKSP